MSRRLLTQLAAPALALVVAMVVSGTILALTGYHPSDVLSVIADKGFTAARLTETINRAAPYYISGVAVAIGFKMNLFNIGVEGQYKVAALVGAWAGAAVSLPTVIHIPFILVVAALTGAAYAAIPGILKATRGVNEVISSIMLNSIAFGLSSYLLQRFFRAPSGKYAGTVGTRPIDGSGRLPSLNGLLGSVGVDLPAGSRLQSYVFVAILVGIVFRVVLWRSRFGFDLRASGSNPNAARSSGVDPKRMIVLTMLFSGAVAGLIGLNNVMGSAGRYTDVSVVRGLGFTGIAVALLGRNHPVGIAFAALLWAFMDAVQTPLSNADLPKQITAILQGISVLSVVIAYEVVRRVEVRRQAAELRRDAGDAPPPETAAVPA